MIKKFNTFSKIIYILFFALTAVVLIIALTTLNQKELAFPGLQYFILFYLLIILISFVAVIIDLILLMKSLTKIFKIKTLLQTVCMGAVIGAVIVILLSLIKHHEFFSSDFFFLLIAIPFLSLFSLFLKK